MLACLQLCSYTLCLLWGETPGKHRVPRGGNHGHNLSYNYLESAEACPEIKKCGPIAIEPNSFLLIPAWLCLDFNWKVTAELRTVKQSCQPGCSTVLMWLCCLQDSLDVVSCLPRMYEQARMWGLASQSIHLPKVKAAWWYGYLKYALGQEKCRWVWDTTTDNRWCWPKSGCE